MLPKLSSLLDELEATLDVQAQARAHARHAFALRWEKVDRLPLVVGYPLPSGARFSPFPYREAHDDPDKMLFNELTHAFGSSICLDGSIGDDLTWTIRPNCGTGVIASMFGAAIELVEDNPPWVRPVQSRDPVKGILDCDPADISAGLCPKVLAIYSHYRETLNRYPNVRRAVSIVLPDLQGPFDTAELLMGSSIYGDLYEKPDDIHRVLAHLAKAQVYVARRLGEHLSEGISGFAHQHGTMIRGNILIRDDSAINVSATTYAEIIAPHDAFVLRELCGGGIHFCGRGQHLVPALLEQPSLTCLDLGQPQMNDLDLIYRLARERRIPLIRIQVTEEELLSGRVLERFPTGVALHHDASSFEEAQRICTQYRGLRTS